jgi:hypothetical protein
MTIEETKADILRAEDLHHTAVLELNRAKARMSKARQLPMRKIDTSGRKLPVVRNYDYVGAQIALNDAVRKERSRAADVADLYRALDEKKARIERAKMRAEEVRDIQQVARSQEFEEKFEKGLFRAWVAASKAVPWDRKRHSDADEYQGPRLARTPSTWDDRKEFVYDTLNDSRLIADWIRIVANVGYHDYIMKKIRTYPCLHADRHRIMQWRRSPEYRATLKRYYDEIDPEGESLLNPWRK